jgi:hypothetical protein
MTQSKRLVTITAVTIALVIAPRLAFAENCEAMLRDNIRDKIQTRTGSADAETRYHNACSAWSHYKDTGKTNKTDLTLITDDLGLQFGSNATDTEKESAAASACETDDYYKNHTSYSEVSSDVISNAAWTAYQTCISHQYLVVDYQPSGDGSYATLGLYWSSPGSNAQHTGTSQTGPGKFNGITLPVYGVKKGNSTDCDVSKISSASESSPLLLDRNQKTVTCRRTIHPGEQAFTGPDGRKYVAGPLDFTVITADHNIEVYREPIPAPAPPPGPKVGFQIGDMIMSFLPYAAFRTQHGDTGTTPQWLECTAGGQTIANTPLSEIAARAGAPVYPNPDCSSAYARGFDGNLPGQRLPQLILDHIHTVATAPDGSVRFFRGSVSLGGGNDEFVVSSTGGATAAVPWKSSSVTPTTIAGTENRPASFVVHFYLKVR